MKLSQLLLTELKDNGSTKGGVSYAGERLIDFLLETNYLHLIDEEGGFAEINVLLSECGIKPIDFPDEKVEIVLYCVFPDDLDDDTIPADVYTEKELIAKAQELLDEACQERGDASWDILDALDAMEYLMSHRNWEYIHTIKKEKRVDWSFNEKDKTFGVTLYYSAQKDSDATPVFTGKELISVANDLLINSTEDDVEEFTSIEDAINYLEEVAEWNPIKEYSQYFKQSELEEVKWGKTKNENKSNSTIHSYYRFRKKAW